MGKHGVDFYRSLLLATRSPTWESIDEALRSELQTVYELMRETRDAVALHMLQGRAQALNDLLKAAADAQATLEKLTKGRM